MIEHLMIVFRWLVADFRQQTRPVRQTIRITNFVYPTVSLSGQPITGWSRDMLDRSSALDSTQPTGATAEWLKQFDRVQK